MHQQPREPRAAEPLAEHTPCDNVPVQLSGSGMWHAAAPLPPPSLARAAAAAAAKHPSSPGSPFTMAAAAATTAGRADVLGGSMSGSTFAQQAAHHQRGYQLYSEFSGSGCGSPEHHSVTVGNTGTRSISAAGTAPPVTTPGDKPSSRSTAGLQSHPRPGVTSAPQEGTPNAAPGAAAQPAQSAPSGTAAFKGTSRNKASRAGRFSSAGQADLPGPGQFRPLHTAVDKHVPGACFAAPSSSKLPGAGSSAAAAAAASSPAHAPCTQQQQLQDAAAGGYRASTGYRVSVAATEAGLRRSSVCTAGATPRSAAEEDVERRAQPGQQAKQQQGGSAAFKTVSRDQRAAVAGGGAPHAADSSCHAAADQQHVLAASSHSRPMSSAIGVSKQTQRRPLSAPTSSPAALGPGAYFRSGALPASLTGKSLLAGHDPHTAAPGFGRAASTAASSQGCTAAAAACRGHSGGCAAQQQSGEAGMWGWAGGEEEAQCLSRQQQQQAGAGFMLTVQELQQGSRPASGTNRQRPHSAALQYARRQHSSVLVAPAAGADSPAMWGQQQQQQQQQVHRPATVGAQQVAHRRLAARPMSAGPLLTAGVRPHSCAPTQQRQHSRGASSVASSRASAGLGVDALQRYSSTGFAHRVKGGRFPESGRDGAAAAAAAAPASTELLYEPRPEVLGHMHRAPGWSLPPNRVETSRKWARLAAQAALQ